MLESYAPEQIYFTVLLICAFLAVVLLIFGDIFDFDGPIDPMLIIPWIAFLSLLGYIGEQWFTLSSIHIFLVSSALSTGLVFLLNFYILVPLRQAESTLSSSEKSFEGRVATILTPIPCQGLGEIQLSSVTGSTNRPAAAFQSIEEPLAAGTSVLIIEVKDRVCYVVPYVDQQLKF